jgi:hypothetical protein
MKRLANFIRLPNEEKAALLQVLPLLIGIRCGLRVLPLQKLYRFILRRGGIKQRPDQPDTTYPGRMAQAIERVTPYVLGENACLTQALAGLFLLRRRGWPAVLRIGVMKKEDGSLQAHAWLMSEGQVVLGGKAIELERYTQLPDLENAHP